MESNYTCIDLKGEKTGSPSLCILLTLKTGPEGASSWPHHHALEIREYRGLSVHSQAKGYYIYQKSKKIRIMWSLKFNAVDTFIRWSTQTEGKETEAVTALRSDSGWAKMNKIYQSELYF